MGVYALAIGRGGSTGLPGKNTCPVLGRPLMAYPILEAQRADSIDGIFLSTDSDEIMSVGRSLGVEHIERPPELATPEALGEDAFVHGWREMESRLHAEGKSIEFIILLFCNAPTITAELIDEGVEILRKNPEIDSAVTVSRYNMWSPIRARRVTDEGLL